MSLKFKRFCLKPGLVLMLTAFFLVGCGKKGPLTLPDKAAQNAHISPSPLPSPIKGEGV